MTTDERVYYSDDGQIQKYFDKAILTTGIIPVFEAMCEYLKQRYDDDLWEFIEQYFEDNVI